jgi:hypothetical protein
VRHGDGADPDRVVLEDGDRNLRVVLAGAVTGMSVARTSAPGSGMRASSGITFRWYA